MPARHKIDQLPDDQLKFVLDHIIDGETDREICFAFEDQFKTKLAKSSLGRWRKAAGDELADRYRMTRYQAKQLIEDMKLDPDSDKHAVVMQSIEDQLLTATRKVVSQDPFKLIIIQQEEKRRKLQSQKLALEERKQAFAEEQARKSEQLQHDRLKIGVDVWQFVLSSLLKLEPTAADLLTKHSEEIVNGLEAYLDNQTA
jgi:hypothetical protein